MQLFTPTERHQIVAHPMCNAPVPCVFPGPAQGYIERRIALNEPMIQHLSVTCIMASAR